jgi:hypothetical protein
VQLVRVCRRAFGSSCASFIPSTTISSAHPHTSHKPLYLPYILSNILMPPKHASRTWGTRFDTLPSSPPPSPRSREVALEGINATGTATNDDASNVKKIDKMPHDASVFVGR